GGGGVAALEGRALVVGAARHQTHPRVAARRPGLLGQPRRAQHLCERRGLLALRAKGGEALELDLRLVRFHPPRAPRSTPADDTLASPPGREQPWGKPRRCRPDW